MNGAPAVLMRRPQKSELTRSESFQSGPCSSTTTFLPVFASTAAKTEPDAPAPTTTTSTFSSLAMSPPPLGRDVRHVGDAEGLVAFHGSVDHVDGVAARHQVDERPGRALPAVELVLAHQVDELALLHGPELREATPLARLARAVDRCYRRPIEVRRRGLDVEDARFEQRLLGRNRKLLIDEMRDARRACARNQGLAQCLQGLGLVGLQQTKGHGLVTYLSRLH